MAVIHLSELPPSTNNLFLSFVARGRVVRVRTDAYKRWIKTAMAELVAQKPGEFGKGPALMRVDIKVNYTRDLDNFLKPLGDLISKAGVIQDDRYFDDIRIRRVKRADWDGAVRIEIGAMVGARYTAQGMEAR